MRRIKDWTEFKKYLDRGLSPQEIKDDDNDDQTQIHVIDGPMHVFFRAYDGTTHSDPSAEWTEYVNNYQSLANKTFTDSNGIPLSRSKITRTGWHYQAHSIEITTSDLSGLYNSDITGTSLGYGTIKFYDNVGTELTVQGDIDTDCVETVVDWEPAEDVEVLGGIIFQASTPADDTRLWIMAAPDIPANLGGSVPFGEGGLNLKFMGTGQIFDMDGRTPKLMPYSAVYHSNKFRLKLTHSAGVKHSLLFVAKLFREIG